jgi:hypothetical protein
MKNNDRLTINDSPEIGNLRYHTYKGVTSKYNKALEVDCYLEAITLMESIIFDRLTSIINETQEKQVKKESFGKIIERTKDIEFLNDLTDSLIEWKNKRNTAIHEMAKSLYPEFNEKYDATKDVAEEGLELFRKVDKAISNFRKTNRL